MPFTAKKNPAVALCLAAAERIDPQLPHKSKNTNTLTGKHFPLADPPTNDDLSALGLTIRSVSGQWPPAKGGVRVMANGMFQGAIVEAYRAPNDPSSATVT
ncbi:MAG TPA: hypothetical protein DDZ51_23665 [Planctomycetaceae bacterium]|nr:hypothetical protein [Planctomycetaceae bacterium]